MLMAVLGIAASARTVTPDQARQVAGEFLGEQPQSNAPLKIKALSHGTGESITQPYYIFNSSTPGQGFVIISGDDRAQRILGYSDTGTFDPDNIPPQLVDLLGQYAVQIKSIKSGDTHSSWSAPARIENSEDGILLETANWGQGAPYNALTPEFDGEHAPTGCVATAMAIVMKYHSWPESYDWDNMPVTDNNPDNSTEIARLMKDVGESVFMEYGSIESSASMNWTGHKLQQDFRYSPDCQFITAQNFSDSEWLSMIRENLESDMPVIYTGSGVGSHAFVVDGVKDDLYHINWGWDGALNGYFALDSLIPDYFNFNDNHGMVVNISPDRFGKEYSRAFTDYGYFYSDCGNFEFMNINVENIEKNIPFDFTHDHVTVPAGFNGEVGLALVSENDEIKYVISSLYYSIVSEETESHAQGVGLSLSQITIFCDIAPTDRLQIVTKEINESDWKLVLGTIESKASIPVINNKPRYGNIKLIIDKNLRMNCTYGYHPSAISSDFKDGEHEIRVLKGHLVSYCIDRINETEGQICVDRKCLSPNNTSQFNGNKIISGDFVSDNFTVIDDYVIEVKIVKSEDPDPSGNEIVIDKIKYILSEGTAEVVGYIEDPKDVTIPSTLNVNDFKIPVTSIGNNAFENCISLRSITLPYTIKSLGENCFLNCYNLEKVHLNENIGILPRGAFVQCRSLKILEPTENIKYIDRFALSYSGLEYFYVPSSMQLAPYDCPLTQMHDLKKIEIDPDHPDWLIYDDCLYHKELNKLCVVPAKVSHTALHFKDGIESIDAFAIFNVESLKEIVIPDNIKRIEYNSISDCANLEYLVLPKKCSFNVLSIVNCPSLKYVHIPYQSPYPNNILDSPRNIKAIYLTVDTEDSFPINIKGIFERLDTESVLPAFFLNSKESKIVNYGDASIYLPGKASGIIDGHQEMWTYKLHRSKGAITITPLIKEIVIDKVSINGKVIEPDANNVYYYGNPQACAVENPDVEVVYTLHGRQQMTTHYTPEFNAELPDEELSGISSPVDNGNSVSVKVSGATVYISGANVNSYAVVCDIAGTMVYQGTERAICGLSPGAYVVSIEGRFFKIMVGHID